MTDGTIFRNIVCLVEENVNMSQYVLFMRGCGNQSIKIGDEITVNLEQLPFVKRRVE